MKGIIASIQGYSLATTQELAEKSIENGVVGIRTEQPISCRVPVIGLHKIAGKEYYITTDKDSVYKVAKWANMVAIDSRRGNREIDWLYAHCHTANIKIIADIEKIEDVVNILRTCDKLKIVKPAYFATTFSKCDIGLIKDIKNISDVPVIAEGGYHDKLQIEKAVQNGADAVCIGAAMDIRHISKKYSTIWEQAG